jgi:hypothetical protein
MATKISDYSSTAASNTDVNGINIGEGMAPSDVNNAMREILAELKNQQAGTDGSDFTVGGNLSVAGNATLGNASGDAVTVNASTVAIPNSLSFDSGTLKIDATNNRVGINKTTPATTLDVNGSANLGRDSISATYVQSGTTITISATSHGLLAGDKIYLDFTSGTGVDASTTVTSVSDANTFICTGATSLSTSGNVTVKFVITFGSNSYIVNLSASGAVTLTSTLSVGSTLTVTGTGYSTPQTLTDGATIDWNTDLGQTATVTIADNRTMNAPTNLKNGAYYGLAVYQDSTGSRTLTWNSVFKWERAEAPTLSTAADAKDFFTFRSDGTNLYEQGRTQGVA